MKNRHSLSEAAKQVLACCRQGQLSQMLNLLDDGLDIEDVNHPEFMPLNVALKNGRWKIAKYLIQHQPLPDKSSCPPLIAATQYKKDLIQGLELVFAHTGNLSVTDQNSRTALMTACLLGHVKKVNYLLSNDDNLHATDRFGMNAYLDAVVSQSSNILDLLIQRGSDVIHQNNNGDNALLIAIQQPTPDTKIIKTLLEHDVDSTQKNKHGKSAYTTAEQKHPMILRLFIQKIESDKQIELPLFSSPEESLKIEENTTVTRNEESLAVKEIQTASNSITTNPMSDRWFNAISEGNLGRLNQLKVKGIAIDITDKKGCTGLIHAAGKGHRAVVSYLIQNRAHVEHRSNNGSTPLSSALISNSKSVVGLLLKHGAKPNGIGPGNYPYVSLAATQWNAACVSMLLESGASINTTDEASMSLYHHIAIAAEYYGNTVKAKQTLQLIHQHGLDINTVNNQGNTALHVLCGANKNKQYKVDDSHIANIAHDMLKMGANPKIINHEGYTAIQYTKKHNLLNTKGVLLSYLDAW